MSQTINHPYTKELQETLNVTKLKCGYLEKRLELIDSEYSSKSEYDKNEAELIKINTQNELMALKRVINEKEKYFVKFMQQYVEDMDEVEANFDSESMTKAIELAKSGEGIPEPPGVEWLAVTFEERT